MYPLLPWKLVGIGLTLVTLFATLADNVQQFTGWPISDRNVVRYLPLGVLIVLSGVFGPTGYYAPWRILWRCFPVLNKRVFPDLNGVWVGSTSSNWPSIKRLVEAAQTGQSSTEQELHRLPEQRDAMAVKLTNSLFRVRVEASLTSTKGKSISITAKPWKDQHSGRIHLSYVYRQFTPRHAITDEEVHFGAADLELTLEDYHRAEGTYWTRRAWRTGRNTAGMLQLSLLTEKPDPQQPLEVYAQEHQKALTK